MHNEQSILVTLVQNIKNRMYSKSLNHAPKALYKL